MKLSRLKDSPQRLLMGPWTHGQYEVAYSGDIDFGLTAHIDYNDLKLAWFDHYLKGMRTEVADWSPVRYFTMGGGRRPHQRRAQAEPRRLLDRRR